MYYWLWTLFYTGKERTSCCVKWTWIHMKPTNRLSVYRIFLFFTFVTSDCHSCVCVELIYWKSLQITRQIQTGRRLLVETLWRSERSSSEFHCTSFEVSLKPRVIMPDGGPSAILNGDPTSNIHMSRHVSDGIVLCWRRVDHERKRFCKWNKRLLNDKNPRV